VSLCDVVAVVVVVVVDVIILLFISRHLGVQCWAREACRHPRGVAGQTRAYHVPLLALHQRACVEGARERSREVEFPRDLQSTREQHHSGDELLWG
jgi:hypothetical protein